mgnify:CR=1 FL=1
MSEPLTNLDQLISVLEIPTDTLIVFHRNPDSDAVVQMKKRILDFFDTPDPVSDPWTEKLTEHLSARVFKKTVRYVLFTIPDHFFTSKIYCIYYNMVLKKNQLYDIIFYVNASASFAFLYLHRKKAMGNILQKVCSLCARHTCSQSPFWRDWCL